MRARTNFNGTKTATTALADDIKQTTQKYNVGEVLKFWLGLSTACGPFQQIAICRDNTKLLETSIYAREQAIICSNSLSDLTVNNSVTVSPLESIVQGKRHCGVFIDVPLLDVAAASGTTAYFYRYLKDITFSGVMDLNQLNPIFNEFPVLTRNYASLYLQLLMTDFLQDQKVVWLNKSRSFDNYLAYTMIPAEKPEIITLLDDAATPKNTQYTVRLNNCRDLGNAATDPKNSTQQIDTAYFDYLSIHNLCFTMENEMAIINLIRAVFMTFAMQQYPTWFFPILMKKIDLIIDQKHATPNSFEALTAGVKGSIFQCFVDQDIVSAPSHLYRSLTFENININDKNYQYGRFRSEPTRRKRPYGKDDGPAEQQDNIFYNTTLFRGSKAIKTYYPNKFMLAWKLATDDSFMRGYNSTKIGARTNIQMILHYNIANGIIDNSKVNDDTDNPENQNNFAGFIGTRSYPISTQIAQTPLVHFLCDSIVRIMFDDAYEPQILNLEVIGEIGGSMIMAVKESAEDKMSRVNYEKQRQGFDQIKDNPRYLINDQLTVWDTKLDREVNPQSKKSRSCGLIGRQIRLNDINGKRCDLSFSYLVAKQFIPNDDINKNKIFHLDNDLENDAVDNLLWIDQFNYNRYDTNKYYQIKTKEEMKDKKLIDLFEYKSRVLGDYYVLDEAQNVWFNNLDNDTYMQLKTNDNGKELEITTTEPWRIRRIADGFEPTLQFIHNDDPENKKQVDHISRIKTDNSIGNLRWVTVSQNNLNKDQLLHRGDIEYVYVDDIDDESIVVNEKLLKLVNDGVLLLANPADLDEFTKVLNDAKSNYHDQNHVERNPITIAHYNNQITSRTLTDTKEKYIAIYSMCAITYLLPISGKSIPSIKLHLSKKRQCLRYVNSPYPNTCVLEAIARYQLKDSKEKRFGDKQVLAKMKEIGNLFYGEFNPKTFEGFNYATDIQLIHKHFNLSVNLFSYEQDDSSFRYYLAQSFPIDSDNEINLLLIQSEELTESLFSGRSAHQREYGQTYRQVQIEQRINQEISYVGQHITTVRTTYHVKQDLSLSTRQQQNQ
ncbi:MAG: hypothetical protein EZS28_011667 [Streblomastix strix]|uniref:HNH nuclease domain-containing protein n=1 Tax=Streblomastix strix TaxID=222440 RepID=A0A5J4WCY0_9EUKA|nr:MAG: hypothetical protein EZS28_011667 [Streblomastix strix]